MKLLEYSEDFESLYSKRILFKEILAGRFNLALSNDQFRINEKVTEAILNNKPLPLLEEKQPTDIIEILEHIYITGKQRKRENFDTDILLCITSSCIQFSLDFPLIKLIDEFKLNPEEEFIFIYLIWNTLNNSESVAVEDITETVFDNVSRRIKYAQKMTSNEYVLTKKNLIEIIEERFINDTVIKLSEKSLKLIEECGLKLLTKSKNKQTNIIEPSKIFAKALYFNNEETKQLDLLKELLHEDYFKELQMRLEAKGLPKGVTALLHGFPGTGKTESVLQIAKETNREIVKVEISQSKSMWYGESEKIIKRIFTDYKSYAKDCELKPILMFNEADAIIGKRKENITSEVDQTENTIQNILLEELENFDGIFLATTNLVKNLDSAFDRRFLFKIEFQKPITSVKSKIWQSKLPCLTESECDFLSNRFDFSGGQIDNIIRKNEIYEIIHGISVDFKNILEFCKSELLVKDNLLKIGFK